MSYLFGNTGGTAWGLKTYNQLFALDRGNVSSANYWDTSSVRNYDTVICSTNHSLLTAYYKNGDPSNTLYWYGTGIYLCENKDTIVIEPGDFACAYLSSSAQTGTLPFVELSTTIARAFGVALTSGTANGGDILMATSGTWPTKRSETIAFGEHVIVDSGASDIGKVRGATSAVIGTIGKLYQASFPIITDSAGASVDGCLTTIWGTGTEIN
jgi:hypothetical protein